MKTPRKKTLREQVSDLWQALHLLHQDWTHCPWCGRRKPAAANCGCKAWSLRKDKLSGIVSERVAAKEPTP